MIEKPTALDYVTNPGLEEGIKNGSITTFTIDERNLPSYQQAADESGFEVQVIAKPGQHYITEKPTAPVGRSRAIRHRPNTNGQENKTPRITAVKSRLPVIEGYVGISLKRPAGVTDDMAFHRARQNIQPA